ncbi:hypothetical protein D3C77_355260 [compost metagenome]
MNCLHRARLIGLEIIIQHAIGRGISTAGHRQNRQIHQILLNDMGYELQIEFGSLYRCFPLKIGNELIAEKRQQGCNQQSKHGHDQNDPAFDGRLSFRRNHLFFAEY